MSSTENKQFMKEIFAEMAKGNIKMLVESFAENISWTIAGASKWSKTYNGIEAVRNELLTPLFERFADRYTSEATRIFADEDFVIVEAKGKVNTKSGKPYNNSYCFIFRINDSKITEITEYCDTELVTAVLDDKPAAVSANTTDSVAAILKLYELRRDDKMRDARQWYLSQFSPQSAMDIIALFRGGERASANFRMLTSYWDTASSLVLNGAIDEKLFLDANTEHVFVYAKIQPFLAEVRQLFGEPDFLQNLENLVLKIPNVEAKIESRKRLAAIWTKQAADSAESR